MDARAIIGEIRNGRVPAAAEFAWFARGLSDGSISDAQAGAFAMAVCLNGLDAAGRAALTLAMRDSGDVIHWDLDGPVTDKHSTGGVGDCTSLVLAPALAACGGYAPFISGRGLGHTGGTLDKMEAIPGVSTLIPPDRLQQIVRVAGCAIVGPTAEVAPADKRLYAIRDVTATVDSLDLITASILSKKFAASPDALVLDVKIGAGALMKSESAARDLARALIDTARAAGIKCRAVISDMDQPLAPSLGNALEVAEVMRILTGGVAGGYADVSDVPLVDLCATLGGIVLTDAGLSDSEADGTRKIRAAIADGRAAEQFGKMIAAMGGPVEFVDTWQRFLPESDVIREVTAQTSGYVTAIDGEALGYAVVDLGGGRKVETDRIDPAVGLTDVIRLGARVDTSTPLAIVHANRETLARKAEAALRAAITISDTPPETPVLIHDRLA